MSLLEYISQELGKLPPNCPSCSLSGQKWVTCTFLKSSKGNAAFGLDKPVSPPELHADGVSFLWILLLGYVRQTGSCQENRRRETDVGQVANKVHSRGHLDLDSPISFHTHRCCLGNLPKKKFISLKKKIKPH